MTTTRCIVVGVVALFSLVAAHGQQTIYVNCTTGDDSWDGLCEEWVGGTCGPKATIQAGIDAAEDGDTVLVADGTCIGEGNRDLDFANGLGEGETRAITVRSENGPAECTIDCEEEGRAFHFHSGEDCSSVVDGFTIRSAYISGHSGAIRCGDDDPSAASSPTISNCIITDCHVGYDGAAIHCLFGSQPVIINCEITGNSADEDGGGIGCQGSSPIIINCLISGNTAGDTGGGLYCAGGSDPQIIHCTIVGNTAGNGGGGVDCTSNSSPSITNGIIWDNTPDAIYVRDGASVDVSHSCVEGDWAGDGNIAEDPLFRDPIGPDGVPGTGDEDSRLQCGSPCIDAGDTTVPVDLLLYVDLDAKGRMVDKKSTPDTGIPAGIVPVTVDMGTYEWYWPVGDINFDCQVNFFDIDPFVALIIGAGMML